MSNERTNQRVRKNSNQPHSGNNIPQSGVGNTTAGVGNTTVEHEGGSGSLGSQHTPGNGSSPAPESRKRNASGGAKNALMLLAALAIGIGVYISFGGIGGDTISEQESQSRSSEYQALLAGGAFPLKFVTADELDGAIDTLPENVTTAQKQELRAQIDAGQVRMAWLSLWDTHSEDGDILRFESLNSIPVEVMALNQKTTIAIPFPSDGNVVVTGVKDGGGGITIALESGATQIAWPTMQPGDQLDLPVTPGL